MECTNITIKSYVDYGYQIEYTLLQINGKTNFTFASEWFKEKEMHLTNEKLNEIIGHILLDLKDLMG